MPTHNPLRALARAAGGKPDEVATVKAVDEVAVTCDVTTAAGLELKGLPLRVLNLAADAGIYAVPALGSDVRISYDGSSQGRPRVVQVQEFDRLVLKKGSKLKIEITKDDKVIIGNEARASHPVPKGDELYAYDGSFHEWARTHTHGAPPTTGPPTTWPPDVPNYNSVVVKIE